jgi:hypothetical protein
MQFVIGKEIKESGNKLVRLIIIIIKYDLLIKNDNEKNDLGERIMKNAIDSITVKTMGLA